MASLLLRLLRKAFRSPPLKGRHPQAAFSFALRSAHGLRTSSGSLAILLAILRALSDLILIKLPSDPLWFDFEDRTGRGNAEVSYRCGFHTGRFR